jgi:hypothetical protein
MFPDTSRYFVFMYSFCGFIGIITSGTVVLTGVLFPKLILRDTRIFSSIIFFISLTDMLGSVGVFLGIPNDGTPECTTQAFLYQFFFPASWVWTALLIFQLRCVLRYQKMWLRIRSMHLIVWSVAAFAAFGPLSTGNSFGQDDELNGYMPCNFRGATMPDYLWGIFAFALIILVCIATMVYYVIEIRLYRKMNGWVATPRQIALYKTTRLYPIAMAACWLPYLGFAYLQEPSHVKIDIVYKVLCCLTALYGPLLALIFFTHSIEARNAWKGLFYFCWKRDLHSLRESLLFTNHSLSEDSESVEDWGFSDSNDSSFNLSPAVSNTLRVSEVQMTI